MTPLKILYAVLGTVFLLTAVGVLGYHTLGTGYSAYQSPTTEKSENNTSTPLVLHLVVTEANFSDLSGTVQPMVYVATPGGLQSSANMTLPAHRLIEVIITNYDRGTSPAIADEYAGVKVLKVSGTVGGTMAVLNRTDWNGTIASDAGFRNVASVDKIAHTFTIQMLGINIPVPAGSTVVAYLRVDSTGTYTWLCMCYCGSGMQGWGGAMQTAGWMEGTVTFR